MAMTSKTNSSKRSISCLERARETPRSLAVKILTHLDDKGGFAEPLLDRHLSRDRMANVQDRRLLTQIVYGTLRMKGRLDWLIGRLYRGDLAAMEAGVRNILRTALYQMYFTDRIPSFAIVDEAVKIAKTSHPATSGLVNAVLRNIIRRQADIVYPDFEKDPAGHISIVHSHPLWLVNRWIGVFGIKETLAICRANNETPPLTIRVNMLRMSREEAMASLGSAGFDVRQTVFAPAGLVLAGAAAPVGETACYRQGGLQIQDEASQWIACLVDPQPGEKILDACAGAGGKTSHLAELMQNQGRVIACDVHGRRLKDLRKNMKRLGISIVETVEKDVSRIREESFREVFDRILVDAPCSGLGTLRRNPEIKWRLAPEDIQKSSDLQMKLLNGAARCLKAGGRLVYSTCTIMPNENETVVAAFLAGHDDFRLTSPPGAIPAQMITQDGFFRTRPDCHGTDGFFGAVLVKKR
jgi:16S rRNA (cytosine967-C5)-methyltransferase